MRLGKYGWRTFIGGILSMVVWACFSGDFARGEPCMRDADCGPQMSCIGGLCGGRGDSGLCGNGLLDVGEECDDGNLEDGDTCTPECRVPESCGNGAVDLGEECDDGNADDMDGCTATCTVPVCGDGIINRSEEVCDDGNAIETDSCTTKCNLSPEPPTLELSPSQVKKFDFHWERALGAQSYVLLERADEEEEFVAVAEMLSGKSHSLTLPLHFRMNASYKLRACNSLECDESAEVNIAESLAEAVGYFKASNSHRGDKFGSSVVLSGDGATLAVGAHLEDNDPGGKGNGNVEEDSGAVYVFRLTDETWSQQAYIKAPDARAYDRFGFSVALSEDGATLAVGAPRESSDASDSGAAYVFTWADEAWKEQAPIKASNAGEDDEFGSSVALSGDGTTLAVGAPGEDGGINGDEREDSGAVYMFTQASKTWKEQGYIKPSNTEEEDHFGASVSLSGEGGTLAVGAPLDDGNVEKDSGAVYVFGRTDGVWVEKAYVKSSNVRKEANFGECVALSGDGSTLAVGAPLEEIDNSGTQAGAVYMFKVADEMWEEKDYVTATNPGPDDNFGTSVALSEDGTILAVGAPREASSTPSDEGDDSYHDAGAVYVYTSADGGWKQQAYVKSPVISTGMLFGAGVSLSKGGDGLACGAPGESSKATGVSGDQIDDSQASSGAVYVY